MTRSSVDAGPEGRRRPCSYCCTVSSVKPNRRANSACVSPHHLQWMTRLENEQYKQQRRARLDTEAETGVKSPAGAVVVNDAVSSGTHTV